MQTDKRSCGTGTANVGKADSLLAVAEEALGELSAREVLAATPRRLRGLVNRSYFQHSTPPTFDGRTLAQTIYHLADGEAAFSVQLKSILLSATEPDLPGYDHDLWLDRLGDRKIPMEPTLQRFELLRAENLEVCATLTEAELVRVGTHAVHGRQSVADLIRTRAGHDLLHLRPMEETIAGRSREASVLRGVPNAKDNPFDIPVKRGRLIAICGLDGAGKTSQALELVDWLRLCGLNAVYHKSPGIRNDLDFLAERVGYKNHIGLFGSDTSRLLRATVRWGSMTTACSALRDETLWLVMDRYVYCEYAATRGQGAGNESLIREMFAGLPTPDLTLFLDIPPDDAFNRVHNRGTDNEPLDDLRAFDAGYRSLPEMRLFTKVDGALDFAAVRDDVRAVMRATFTELRDRSGVTDAIPSR